jgi:hypothetical protein
MFFNKKYLLSYAVFCVNSIMLANAADSDEISQQSITTEVEQKKLETSSATEIAATEEQVDAKDQSSQNTDQAAEKSAEVTLPQATITEPITQTEATPSTITPVTNEATETASPVDNSKIALDTTLKESSVAESGSNSPTADQAKKQNETKAETSAKKQLIDILYGHISPDNDCNFVTLVGGINFCF